MVYAFHSEMLCVLVTICKRYIQAHAMLNSHHHHHHGGCWWLSRSALEVKQ